MFGINDSNQTTSPPAGGDKSTSGPTVLPASPFLNTSDTADSQTDSPVVTPMPPNGQQATAPAFDAAPPPLNEDALVNLKEQALNSLAPLVGHLDQTPEEKFKTTMMLIQASDNAGLVKEAYEAANKIADEKTRAQALLDVVNEINYFTQHKNAEK